MVNQDPQPEIFTTTFSSVLTTQVNTLSNVIYTNQGHAEQVLIYAMKVDGIVSATGVEMDFQDFEITLSVGANNIPTYAFDGGVIYTMRDKTISFACPIAINFKQPLIVTFTNPIANASTNDITITLIGETMILK
jgi:hypothetical protein